MKRIIVGFLVCVMAVAAVNAQAVVGNKFGDNWSFRLNVGATSHSTMYDHGFFNNMRPVVGIGFDKKITPVLGFGLEFSSAFNTLPGNGVAFDNTNLMLLNNLNLNNLFAGYKGTPRLFEVETVLGIGWLHYFYNSRVRDDYNDLSAKLGLDLNFNLGESKAWTLALKPAILYDLEKPHQVRFNKHGAALEFTVGLRYHFKTSNGKHYFTRIEPPCDPDEINALNDQINRLRREAEENKALADKNAREKADIERAFEEYKRTHQNGPVVSKESMDAVVIFRQNSAVISDDQAPTIARVATYLKNNSGTKVKLDGYASPEGPAEWNAQLSTQRAEAVKKMLVEKYDIAEDRIIAEGKGVGDIFEKATWNRACICIVNE